MTPTAEAMFAADEASRGLGVELLDHGEGTAALRMTVTPAMVNGHGIAHGGYVFLLADSAFACACNSHDPVTVAAGADITFVAPAYEGDVWGCPQSPVVRPEGGSRGVRCVLSECRADARVLVVRGCSAGAARGRAGRRGAGGTLRTPPGRAGRGAHAVRPQRPLRRDRPAG
ncbi:hotdog fold thioesterase [Streptomyces coeruleorubidus]|uniref:hotdog fold thioesterase n=1 Tax=Streptomyces coeruleorubidus TaxID=116188 RepID=UPI0037913506